MDESRRDRGTLGFMVVSLVVLLTVLVMAGLRAREGDRTATATPVVETAPEEGAGEEPTSEGPGSLRDASPNM